MNILFVCKWNRFRSKAAEAIFNKINKNKKHNAKSAGLFPGVPVTEDIITASKKRGIKISKKQKCISHKLAMWSDIIIIVADDVPKSIFKEFKENDKKKIIQWKTKDIIGEKVNKREEVMKEIKKKIEKFLKQINKP